MAIEPTLIAAIDCSELERSIDAYLDGEFDDRERAEVDAHLAACAACRTTPSAQRRLRAALRAKLREAMAAPPRRQRPADLRERIEASLSSFAALGTVADAAAMRFSQLQSRRLHRRLGNAAGHSKSCRAAGR